MDKKIILNLDFLKFDGYKFFFEKGNWIVNDKVYSILVRGKLLDEWNLFSFEKSFYENYDKLVEDLRSDTSFIASYKLSECTFVDWSGDIETEEEVGLFYSEIEVKEFLKGKEIEKYYVYQGTYDLDSDSYKYEDTPVKMWGSSETSLVFMDMDNVFQS